MKAKILPPTPENIAIAAHAIQKGELVGMPTETVYGLAGDCRSPGALAKIFETKERPTFDPLIIHVGLMGKEPTQDPFAEDWIAELEDLHLIEGSLLDMRAQERVQLLIHRFWPGPLTLVLPKHPDVPDLATSGLPTVAVRMPQHPVAQALIAAAQCPLAAPSANRFGRISPTTPQAVDDELGDRIELILDGGPSQIGLESTVVSFDRDGNVFILRPGGVSKKELEETVGGPVYTYVASPTTSSSPQAPGMLESHYAPQKPFSLLPKKVSDLQKSDLTPESLKSITAKSTVGLLLQAGNPESLSPLFSKLTGHPVLARTLSLSGDLQEAARNLFAEMRWLDSSEVKEIFVEPCQSDYGLGHAIIDRLKRASVRPPQK